MGNLTFAKLELGGQVRSQAGAWEPEKLALIMAESLASDSNRQMEQEAHTALVRPLELVASSRVLVVGGGAAWQQAALDAAALGLPVARREANLGLL